MKASIIPRADIKFNSQLFKNWSPKMAYVLGFIFADGSIYKNPKGYYYLEFTSTDLELIEKIKSLISSNHKIGFRNRKHTNSNWKDSYRLQLSAKEIRQDLAKLGVIEKKSLIIKFPQIPAKYLGHFVRGYFDGDGNVNIAQYWRKDRGQWKWKFSTRFISGSKKFLLGLHKSLKTIVKYGFISNKERGYELIYGHHDGVALFNLMYNNVSSQMFLERKYKTFQKAFEVLNLRA